jgi:hypothetical protein
MSDKAVVAEKTRELIAMTAAFCDQYLDQDYKQLCEKLILKMSRKRNVPFLSGRLEIWAAAVVYAIGSINFLFDKSFEPYASADDICRYFGTSKSTTSQKAKVIRDMFRMNYWDKEFSTAHMRASNPYADMVVVNGLIVPVSSLPPDIQVMIRRKDELKRQ